MPIDPLFSSMHISASGLTANRRWMDSIAENLANAQTTRTESGGPYRRKTTTFKEVKAQLSTARLAPRRKLNVEVTREGHMRPSARGGSEQMPMGAVEAQISEDNSQLRRVYDPDHPDADAEGFVTYPNVEVVREMVDLITASRAYEANVTVINAAKTMNKKALDI